MKCIAKGCTKEALERSNYCQEHKPNLGLPSKRAIISSGKLTTKKAVRKVAAKKQAKKAPKRR